MPQKIRPADHVPLVCGSGDQSQDVFWKKDGNKTDAVLIKTFWTTELAGSLTRVDVVKAWSWSRLCGGTKSQWWWTRWMAGTTPVTARTGSTSTTPLFSSKWKKKRSSWRKCPRKKVSSGRTSVFEGWFGSHSSAAPPGFIHCSAPNYTGPFYCSWSRANTRSNAAVFLLKATRWDPYSSFLSTHQLVLYKWHLEQTVWPPQQEWAGNSLRGGRWWVRHSVSGRQLPVQRGTAPHRNHRPLTQLLPLGNLHQDLLHERHRWAIVFPSSWNNLQPILVVPPHRHPLLRHILLSVSLLSNPLSDARIGAQPAEERLQRVQLELPRLLGKALLLLRPQLPGQGGPPQPSLRQRRSSRTGKPEREPWIFPSFPATLHARLFSHRSTTQTTPSLKSTWRPRSTCSAWELRTSTPEGPIAPGATAGKCFPQRVCWLMEPWFFVVLTRSILLHLQSQQGGRELPTSLSRTKEMTLSLAFIGTVFRLVQYLFIPFGF